MSLVEKLDMAIRAAHLTENDHEDQINIRKNGFDRWAHRILHELSYKTDGFVFDLQLPTGEGKGVTVDGFMEQEDRFVFVRSRCDEPYEVVFFNVDDSLAALYRYLCDQLPGTFAAPEKKEDPFLWEGQALCRFELGDMLRLLLGIAQGVAEGRFEGKRIDFLYLLYDPTELSMAEADHAEVCAIYEQLCEECNLLDMAALFALILTYLRDEMGVGSLSDEDITMAGYNFTFTLCNQEFYPLLLSM